MQEANTFKQSYNKILVLSLSRILSMLLVFYVYFPFFWNIMENTFSIPVYVEYGIELAMSFIAIILSRKISRDVLLFFLFMILVVVINLAVVDYPYYVFVEAFQAIVVLAVPCFYISSLLFKLNDFLLCWYKFSRYNIVLLLLALLLFKLDLVHYSIFTGICLPNIFIISYQMMCGFTRGKFEEYLNIIIMVFNLLAVAILGGRTVSFVCLFVMIVSFVFSVDVKNQKKALLILFIGCIFSLILAYYNELIIWIGNFLSEYGLKSRTINIIDMQMNSGDIYLTGRAEIYSECLSYIYSHLGLPGGFGLALYITGGKYYYTHNIFLQLLTTFGIPGTILLFSLLIVRYITIKNMIASKYKKLLSLMFVTYFIVSLTGSSIWIHYLSTIFIALFFFGKDKLTDNINS